MVKNSNDKKKSLKKTLKRSKEVNNQIKKINKKPKKIKNVKKTNPTKKSKEVNNQIKKIDKKNSAIHIKNVEIKRVELSDEERTLIMQVNLTFSSLDKYPISISYNDFLISKDRLKKLYEKSKKYPWLVQECLFRINEKLSEHFVLGNRFLSMEGLLNAKKDKKPTEQDKKIARAKIYNSFFRPPTSTFVVLEYIELLGDLAKNDIYALKLLTRYLSYILLRSSEFDRMAKVSLIDAILKGNKDFGLLTLASYARYTPDDYARNYILEKLSKKYTDLEEEKDPAKLKVRSYLRTTLHGEEEDNISMHY